VTTVVHRPLKIRYTRLPDSRLKTGCLAAHVRFRLMLLGSPPDMVHEFTLRETGSSSLLIRSCQYIASPGAGIHPCCSGLQVTRHRWLPD